MKIYVQYPQSVQLISTETQDGCRFSVDGKHFFDVLLTERGVRVDSEATMGRRRYYYGNRITLRFGKQHKPIVTARGHPSKPVGFLEKVFEIA